LRTPASLLNVDGQEGLIIPTASISEPDGRRTDLDWVRIGAFALLIFYHIGVFYAPGPTAVGAISPRPLPWLVIPMVLVNPWRLLVLFIVSGAATRFMNDKMSTGALLSSRSSRLLVPLVFGVLIVVPPQVFVQVVERCGFSGSYFSFWEAYLEADQHLWLWILGVFGIARHYLANRDGPIRRYLTDAIFPFYIIHQTTIEVVGHYLAKERLPLGIEAILLIGATIASCFVTYEVARRIRPLRPLFGLKPATVSRSHSPAKDWPIARGLSSDDTAWSGRGRFPIGCTILPQFTGRNDRPLSGGQCCTVGPVLARLRKAGSAMSNIIYANRAARRKARDNSNIGGSEALLLRRESVSFPTVAMIIRDGQTAGNTGERIMLGDLVGKQPFQ
jgi:hypothetical protein